MLVSSRPGILTKECLITKHTISQPTPPFFKKKKKKDQISLIWVWGKRGFLVTKE